METEATGAKGWQIPLLGWRVSRRLALVLEVAALIAWLLIMRGMSAISHDDLQVLLFYHYGHSFWFGNPAQFGQPANPRFHTLPAEYPPLSMLLFSLTVLPLLPDPIQAVTLYTVWMAVLAFISYFIFRRFEGERRARLYALALFICTSSVLLVSFDLAPAFATLGAFWATQRRKFSLAYIMIALGILLKLYPIFVLPVVVIEQVSDLSGAGKAGQRLRALLSGRVLAAVLRGLAICVALVAAVYAGSFLLNAQGTLSAFGFASQRPLQIESTPAALLWISHFFGVPITLGDPKYASNFGAFNWLSPQDGPFKLLSLVALVAGCLWVYWRQLAGRLHFKYAFLAALCVVVATNKVLSPQYFIWLLPLVVAVDCFDGVWLAICVLTLLEHPLIQPIRHLSVDGYYTLLMVLVILRNALLIVATLRLILRRPAIASTTAEHPTQTPSPADAVVQPGT